MPQTCAACGCGISSEANPALCIECHEQIAAAADAPYCPRCGRTMHPLSIRPRDCSECRTERYWNIAGMWRLGPYTDEIRRLILRLKYSGRERNARVLAELMTTGSRLPEWIEDVDCLVPAPMHWLRRLVRPCDHARIIAEALSSRLGIPVLRAARRVRHTQSQTRMPSRAARLENVAGCFAARWWAVPHRAGTKQPMLFEPAELEQPFAVEARQDMQPREPCGSAAHSQIAGRTAAATGRIAMHVREFVRGTVYRGGIAGKRVCIVDNLVVTGATIRELSKVLRRAGARQVYAAVVARSAPAGDFQALLRALTPDASEESQ